MMTLKYYVDLFKGYCDRNELLDTSEVLKTLRKSMSDYTVFPNNQIELEKEILDIQCYALLICKNPEYVINAIPIVYRDEVLFNKLVDFKQYMPSTKVSTTFLITYFEEYYNNWNNKRKL